MLLFPKERIFSLKMCLREEELEKSKPPQSPLSRQRRETKTVRDYF